MEMQIYTTGKQFHTINWVGLSEVSWTPFGTVLDPPHTILLQNKQQSQETEILIYFCLFLLFWEEKKVKYLLTES